MTDLRDRDELTLPIPDGAHACVLWPAGAADPASCAGIAPLRSPGGPGPSHVVGIARLRADPAAGPPSILLVLALQEEPGIAAVKWTTAPAIAAGWARAVHGQFAGATLRQPHPGGTRVTIGGQPGVQMSADFEGLPASQRGLAHQTAYAVASQEGLYLVTVMSSPEDAARADALASEMVAGAHLAHPAPLFRPAVMAGFGALAALGLAGVITLVVVVWRHRRGSRAPAG